MNNPTDITVHLVQKDVPWITTALQWLIPSIMSAIVALFVLWRNTIQATKAHLKRVAADEKLAERKIALDQEFNIWKRRAEISEETLALFYEAHGAFSWVRSPVIFGGEGKSRKPIDGEEEKLKERRDNYYVPLERLKNSNELFSKLQSLKFTYTAHFGEQEALPFAWLIEAHNAIQAAAGILMQMAAQEDYAPLENYEPLRRALGYGVRPDDIDEKINRALEQMKVQCSRHFQMPTVNTAQFDDFTKEKPQTASLTNTQP